MMRVMIIKESDVPLGLAELREEESSKMVASHPCQMP